MTRELGEGPLEGDSLLLLLHFVTSLEPVMVGWGLFQNILRSVPKRQRDVDRESPVVVPGYGGRHLHALLTLYPKRPGSSRPKGHCPEPLRVAGTLALSGLQALATH